MRQDYTKVKNIYIICGKTDMRKGIDGLATLIQDYFELDPYSDSIFLFAGGKKDRYKCLYFDGDGFTVLYKRQGILRMTFTFSGTCRRLFFYP
ncbi:IS66 family insertion sequence element accessory protein TnpB [Sporosarcina beigongshangi]|uniref:IS66 family insertion sequence element accessory protein TnpB n=1 Tax=Sporosarcina beigongshangi TaxID=2782538 RepID=UPI002ACE2C94|nr:IS66 family insertion sequence element accessory protein TnpB [Sporosarcina beigongshangi]